MSITAETWPKVLLNSLIGPLVLAFLGGFYIPKIVAEANKQEELGNARRTKALYITDQNMEFTNRLNVLKTRMLTFHRLNVRGKLSPPELKEARRIFQNEYTDDYFALDRMAWWWYWRIETEAQVFDLLSQEDGQKLRELITKYGENTNKCIGAIHPIWALLSSADYKLDQSTHEKLIELEEQMKADLEKLYMQRDQLVKSISLLFTRSRYEPDIE